MSGLCKQKLANKVTLGQLSDTAEITFSLKKDTSPCDFALLRNLNGNGTYKMVFPSDSEDCLNTFCRQDGYTVDNTTTQQVTGTLSNGNGNYSPDSVITLKLFFSAPVTADSTITVALSNPNSSSDVSNYVLQVKAGTVGWHTYFVYLGTPTSITGTGLTQYTRYITYNVSFDYAQVGLETTIKYIGFYANYIDTRFEDIIKASCLQDPSLSLSAEALETLCKKAIYNDSTNSAQEFSVTLGNFTPNIMLLNPYIEEDGESDGFDEVSYSYTVDNNGSVMLDNLATHPCGFIYVEKVNCGNFEDVLRRVYLKDLIDENNYTEFYVDEENGIVYVSPSYAGQNITVSYLVNSNVQSFDMTTENLNERRVEMIVSLPVEKGNAKEKYTFFFKNVLITSETIPFKGDSQLQVTLSIYADEDGKIGRIMRQVK